MKQKTVIIDTRDNVATALSDLAAGDTVEVRAGDRFVVVKLTAAVPFGHKLSLANIEPGSPVVKYGETIGIATASIRPGDYVHVHNVASTRARGDLAGGSR